jgi:membrane peptidoglycan carboxypeptidase
MTPVITKIEDREGEIIWEYDPNPETVLSKPVSGMISEILFRVVENGTGQKARNEIRLFFGTDKEQVSIPIPAFGKTGTANRFTNSSFAGFIPGADSKSKKLSLDAGYTIVSYVGYDDNRPMKGKRIALYGASGALPLWIDTANAIINRSAYRESLDLADLAFNQPDGESMVNRSRAFDRVPVSPVSGLLSDQNRTPLDPSNLGVLGYINRRNKTILLRRLFEPLGGVHDQRK